MERQRNTGGHLGRIVLAMALLAAGLTFTELALPTATASAHDWNNVQLERGDSTGSNGQGSDVAVATDNNGVGLAAVSNGGGEVLVYGENIGGTGNWGLATTIPSSAVDNTSDSFGSAIALEAGSASQDAVLVVGDPDGGDHDACFNRTGLVAIFTLSQAQGSTDLTTWTHSTTFLPPSAVQSRYNNLGSSVDIDGRWVMAGAPGINVCLEGAEDQYVAIYDLENPTAQPASWKTHDTGEPGWAPALGRAVAIAGDYAFYSAPGEDYVCMSVYYTESSDSSPAWHESGCREWPLAQPLSSERLGGLVNNVYGDALAFNPETNQLFIALPDNSYTQCSSTNCADGDGELVYTCVYGPGEVYVYSPDLSDVPSNGSPVPDLSQWNLAQTLTPSGIDVNQFDNGKHECPKNQAPEGTYFGASLALDPGTGTLLVGMSEQHISPAGNGAVVEFTVGGSANTWTEQRTFAQATALQADGAAFGASTAIAPSALGLVNMVVGAPDQPVTGTSDSSDDRGYAYVFGQTNPASVGLSVERVIPEPPTPITTADEPVYQVTLSVTEAQPAMGTVVTVSLDPAIGTVELTSDVGPWSCSGATCTATAAIPGGTQQVLDARISFGAGAAGQQFQVTAEATWTNPSDSVVVATAEGRVAADTTLTVAIEQLTAGPTVSPGTTVDYQVTVTNTGSAPADQPVVYAEFSGAPADFEGDPFLTWTGDSEPPWICYAGSKPFCDTSAIAPGRSEVFTLSVPLSNSAPVGELDVNVVALWSNPAGGTATTSAQTIVAWPTTPSFSVAIDLDGSAAPGQSVPIAFGVNNLTGTTVVGLEVELSASLTGGSLPVDIASFTVDNPTSWACAASSPDATTCTTDDLPASEGSTIRGTIQLSDLPGNDPVVASGDRATLTLDGTLQWANGPSGVGTLTDTDSVAVGAPVTVGITQTPSVTPPVGQPVTVTVIAQNTGSQTVQMSVLRTQVPTNAFSDITWTVEAENWFCYQTIENLSEVGEVDVGICEGDAPLEPGDSVTLQLQATLEAAGRIGAEALLQTPLQARVWNSLDVVPGEPTADLAMAAASPTTMLHRDRATDVALEVRNHGPSPAAGVEVRVALDEAVDATAVRTPDGVRHTTATLPADPPAADVGTVWSCWRHQGALHCRTDDHTAADEVHRFDVEVRAGGAASPGSVHQLRASVTSATPETDLANNATSVTLTVASLSTPRGTRPLAAGPVGSGVGRGRLPVTGAAIGVVALVGLGLLAAGGLAAASGGTRRRYD